MTFKDTDDCAVTPEFLAGYIAYGNDQPENPFTLLHVRDMDWTEQAMRSRKINARHARWANGYNAARQDSEEEIRYEWRRPNTR